MKNEITTITPTRDFMQENQQRIMEKDGSKVYPITVPLRKKLEQLKEESIGDLRTQLRFIREEKIKEYEKQQENELKKLQKTLETKTKTLQTQAYKIMKIKRRIDEQKNSQYHKQAIEFYKKVDKIMEEYPELIIKFESYDFPIKGYANKEYKPLTTWELAKQDQEDKKSFNLTINEQEFKNKTKKEFQEKYGEAFRTTEEKINSLSRQFQEALLFGDMEIAKRVYYNLKQADQFLQQLRELNLN